ncbi:Glycerol uptake facilitator protein [Alkalibacterium sp. AK22]|uniref:MIP/aquaporin family protein n=1 Tax=Alkalibacterium sp. AK22 TaxID=1229520 RepID=UPI00044DE96F|nr:MIP/aquaporin family protein [Alkalibacterium sp. AK22]EXJ24389.1 Glycerol uptake facilitator protein [Alkalibacterium sp. AK22]
MDTTVIQQLTGEFFGTLILIYIGNGVVAGNVLKKTKAFNSGWLHITFGWGLAVTMAIYSIGWLSPAHLNPAVTLGMAVAGQFDWALVLPYILVQILGGLIGASLVWIHYYPHFEETKDADTILSVFSTAPAIKKEKWNVVSEAFATAFLVYALLAFTQGDFTDGLNPVIVGLLILTIGLSLGGTTGYAINPARDLGPRLAHALLPVANKGDSNWPYAWIPVVGPFVGSVLGGLVFLLITSIS